MENLNSDTASDKPSTLTQRTKKTHICKLMTVHLCTYDRVTWRKLTELLFGPSIYSYVCSGNVGTI